MTLVPWLFRPRSRIPDGEVIYAIGDIHGRDDLLAEMHNAIEQDLKAASRTGQATVIYLGDYVDRGPASKAVIDRLLERPVDGARPIYLKGNHEDAMLRFLAGERGSERWLTMGGGATARSYGVALRSGSSETMNASLIREHLINTLPARHFAFLEGLKMLHEAGDYLFVHAGIKPGRPLNQQSPQDLMWIRREFLDSRRDHGRIIVHGHAAADRPVIRRNRICVDTGAFATDQLSCLVLSEASRHFITAAL